METAMRQTWAFLFRGYHITRRYIGWVVVFNFYAVVTSATVALIGVAENKPELTLTLVVGALLWNYLSWLYQEIAMSIAYERWEGTLEYTFMAPVSRAVHLLGVSLFSLVNSIVTSIIVLIGLMLFTNLTLRGANMFGVVVVLGVSTLAFVGLGLFAAVFPVMSAERGAEATHIFQGSLLLVSGVYYPVDVLPGWMQPLSAISPATYTLSACRKLFGVGNSATTPELLAGAPLSAVSYELLVLAVMGAILLPLGLMVFIRVEAWAKSLDIDIMATARATNAALPHLERAGEQGGSGAILNIASISGYGASARSPAYGAAKAAVISYTASQALLLAPKRIRVNAIAPGSIEFPGGLWEQRKAAQPQLYNAVLKSIPWGRLGRPE